MKHCAFGKFCHRNALRLDINPPTTEAGSQRYVDALYGVNAGAERTPCTAHVLRGWQSFQSGQIRLGKAGAAALCNHASKSAQNDTHVASIYAGLTASAASSIIAAADDTVYPLYLPLLLQKLEQF